MSWVIPCLVLAAIAAGPVLAKVEAGWARRMIGWLVLAGAIATADFALSDAGPILRMVGICCVLLGGMKGLVYAEWAGARKTLSLTRYGMFSLLWFGMDPAGFQRRSTRLDWKRDVGIGLLLMGIGALGAWWVWKLEWRQILVMFLPMSLGFHFGALRVLKGVLRAVGFPVRTLFPNLLEAKGVADFWSRRWNVGYSQMMQRLVGRPVESFAGKNAAVMAVFLGSGVLHELAITLPVKSGFGLPTLYFAIHGILVLVERKCGRSFGKIPALLGVVLPLGVLFPPAFQREVIARCLGVFDLLSRWLATG